MKTKFLKIALVAMIFGLSGMNIFNSQKEKKSVDYLTLENVEALAGVIVEENDMAFCPTCGTCTGTFYVCESDYEQWWSDAQKNCSSLDVVLIPVIGC